MQNFRVLAVAIVLFVALGAHAFNQNTLIPGTGNIVTIYCRSFTNSSFAEPISINLHFAGDPNTYSVDVNDCRTYDSAQDPNVAGTEPAPGNEAWCSNPGCQIFQVNFNCNQSPCRELASFGPDGSIVCADCPSADVCFNAGTCSQ